MRVWGSSVGRETHTEDSPHGKAKVKRRVMLPHKQKHGAGEGRIFDLT